MIIHIHRLVPVVMAFLFSWAMSTSASDLGLGDQRIISLSGVYCRGCNVYCIAIDSLCRISKNSTLCSVRSFFTLFPRNTGLKISTSAFSSLNSLQVKTLLFLGTGSSNSPFLRLYLSTLACSIWFGSAEIKQPHTHTHTHFLLFVPYMDYKCLRFREECHIPVFIPHSI